MSTERRTVVIADIEFMLHNGFTRTKDDKNYNEQIGSIEEHYNLSKDQVKLMFRDERLKKLRTKKVAVPQFVITEGERTIDTLPTMQNTTVSTTINNTPATTQEELVSGGEVFEVTEA